MPLIYQTVITDEDIQKNTGVFYVSFLAQKHSEALAPNQLPLRFKYASSRLGREDYYIDDIERDGLEILKGDFKVLQDKLKEGAIVIISGREFTLAMQETEEHSPKIQKVLDKGLSSLYASYFNKDRAVFD